MKFEELSEYVGENVAEQIRNLPLNTKTRLWNAIAEWKERGIPNTIAIQYALEWITMDYIRYTATESIRHHEMIDEGITYLYNHHDWVNLTKVAKRALTSATNVCVNDDNEISKHMFPLMEVKLGLLNAGVDEYGFVIKTLKELMSKQAIKWINTILNDPESEHRVSWKKHAGDLIKDLMVMDNYFHYDFDNNDRLRIKKSHGIYGGGIHYAEHIEVYYCDSEMEDFLVTGSQYFHVTDLDEAISIFIERILSGEPRNPQGAIVTLKDISYRKAWQK